VKALPPAVMLLGAMEVSAGAGLLSVIVSAFEGPTGGAGFTTVTGKVSAVTRSVAKVAAFSCVTLT